MPYYINPPPQNPLMRFIAAIFGVVVLAGAFMVGMVALLVIGGVVLLAGIVIWIRVLFIKRKLQKNGVDFSANNNVGTTNRESPSSGQIIDAEYTVVSEQQDERNE